MSWGGSNPTDRILMHLAEIGSGRCSITDDSIVAEPDSDMRQVLLGLLVLHEDLSYASHQRTEAEAALRLVAEERERLLEERRQAVEARDHFLAVCGQSRGGELALLLGATFPEINAVIAWMPSGVVFWALGLAEPGDTRPRAAWTYRGKPLPFLQQNNTSIGPAPVAVPGRPVAYAEFYRRHLQDKRAVERAAIQVERTRGPILLVSGEDDQMWPSSELADIALRRLEAHRHPYPFQHLKYVAAGHTIIIPYWPLTVRAHTLGVEGLDGVLLSYGGTAKADAEAGVDAWRNTLAFLKNGVDGRR